MSAERPRRVGVFCGGRPGAGAHYAETARSLGRHLAERSVGMVFGGSSLGLMGEVSRAHVAAGGTPRGILPHWLTEGEPPMVGCEIELVPTMAARKERFMELASGFVVMPGGFGTLDELFEVLTHNQLGRTAAPVVLLDPGAYWSPLLAALENAVVEGFVDEQDVARIGRQRTVEDAVEHALGPPG